MELLNIILFFWCYYQRAHMLLNKQFNFYGLKPENININRVVALIEQQHTHLSAPGEGHLNIEKSPTLTGRKLLP